MITTFIYKCRLCGELDDSLQSGGSRPHISLMLGAAVDNVPAKEAMAPRMLGIHCCADGNLGVTDLQGTRIYQQ